MNLFLDNTGLHAAGESLDGRSRGDADVKGLLQLGTLLIFAERLHLNGFELDTVAGRTREIRDMLVELGLPSSSLAIGDQDDVIYGRACISAANAAADDLASLSSTAMVSAGPVAPTGLPEGAMAQEAADMLSILSATRSETPRHFHLTALQSRARGAAVYMLASSSKLRRAVKDCFPAPGELSPAVLEQLGIFLRLYLNDALAEERKATYTPAVSRAAMMRQQFTSLIHGMETVVENAAAALTPRTLGVPAVSAALLDRSKGEPAAVVAEALRLRDDAKGMRRRISTIATKVVEGGPAGQFELGEELRDARRAVHESLGLAQVPRLLDALEIQLILGVIPKAKIKPAAALDAYESWRRRRRYAVLTELSKSAAYSVHQQRNWEKLVQASSRKKRG
ncbi:MAG TPA: hypothetical protein VEL28_03855 [Candidatus Binatia bacterium]|nr:hypothetical protein [Candidatus Binatia bacterium]